MPVIDFGELNDKIVSIESLIHEYNIVERELILNQCLIRLRLEIQKNKEQDVMNRAVEGLPFGKLLSRAMKTTEGKE